MGIILFAALTLVAIAAAVFVITELLDSVSRG